MTGPVQKEGSVALNLVNQSIGRVTLHGKIYEVRLNNWGELSEEKVKTLLSQLGTTLSTAIADPKPRIIVKKEEVMNGDQKVMLNKTEKTGLEKIFNIANEEPKPEEEPVVAPKPEVEEEPGVTFLPQSKRTSLK